MGALPTDRNALLGCWACCSARCQAVGHYQTSCSDGSSDYLTALPSVPAKVRAAPRIKLRSFRVGQFRLCGVGRSGNRGWAMRGKRTYVVRADGWGWGGYCFLLEQSDKRTQKKRQLPFDNYLLSYCLKILLTFD